MKQHTMILRQRAAEACLQRFNGQRLDYKRYDCVRLARFLFNQMGHSTVTILKGRRWGTRAGAEAAMRASGLSCLSQGVDALGFARIPPAAAIIGDLVAIPVPQGDAFGCSLMVCVGNGRVLGLDGRGTFRVLRTHGMFTAAWRVEPHG